MVPLHNIKRLQKLQITFRTGYKKKLQTAIKRSVQIQKMVKTYLYVLILRRSTSNLHIMEKIAYLV